MKTKKMFLLFAAFIFAAVAGYNIHLAQSNQNSDVSLADIAVMTQADGESGGSIDCGNPLYIPNETLRHRMCIPMIRENYLKCVYEDDVCCDPSAQTTCSWN